MAAVSATAIENQRAYQREYYLRNKKKAAANWKRYYKKNRKKVIASVKKHYQKNKEAKRIYMVGYKFKLSKEDYLKLEKKHGGLCGVCSKKQRKPFKRLAVDHDHKTDKVRGLLCNPCNRAIGMMQDDPKLLWKAALYLRKN